MLDTRRSPVRLLGLALVAVLLGSCSGAHASHPVQVLVFSDGSGSAEVTVEAGADADDEAAATAVVESLGRGRLVGTRPSAPELRLDAVTAEVVDLGRDPVRFSIASLRQALADSGVSGEEPVFVSVCTSARTGRASGVDIELAHLDSCATWDSMRSREPARAEAVLTFGSRRSPAQTSAIFTTVLALIGLGLAVLSFASRRPRLSGFAYLGTVVVVVVALGISAVSFMFAYRLDRPWGETGQVFDRDLASSVRALAIASLLTGAALPAIVLMAGRRVTRRRWRG